MALYKNKFENVYEKNLKSEIGEIETVDVTENTTLIYSEGLHIDVTGKTINRTAKEFDFDTPNHKLEYDTSYTEAYLQLGTAAVNWQANIVNVAAAATFKTETSSSYNLMGALFFNPSPIKIKRSGAKIDKKYLRSREFHLLNITMAKQSKLSVKKKSILSRLHVIGL